MAASSACRSSLSQPLTGSGKALIALRQKEANKSCSSSPVSVSLASASHLRAEVAELCSQASVCAKQRNNTLVSEFWDQTSRDSLSSKTRRSRKASNLVSGSSSSPLPVVVSQSCLSKLTFWDAKSETCTEETRFAVWKPRPLKWLKFCTSQRQ
jgi:hypothetical protein